MKEILFAENLKTLRIAKKMKQSELATILGVDRRTVSAWENKLCEPSLIMLAKICDIFEEDFNSLLT